MKNLKFLLLVLLPALFVFSGCSEDPADDLSPTLEFIGGGTYVDRDVTLLPGEEFTVKLRATQNATSKSKLANFKGERKIVNTAVFVDSTFSESEFNIVGPITAANIETVETFTFTITDKKGEFTSLSFKVTTEAADTTTALAAPEAFEWERCGGTAGTGLAKFGLAWTSNGDGTSAIIKEDAGKLVVLTNTEWTSITTQEDLKAAVDNGTAVGEYTGVSAQATAAYDDVLATMNGSDYYLIHVTNGTVTTGAACGTKIVITGEYRK